jgi:nicotinate-nucleotide pyrophosphorylase (carboxylating)
MSYILKSPDELINDLIDLAFAEDIGDGDHTTLSCIPAETRGKSMLLVKEDGILAGVNIAERIFHRFDESLIFNVFIKDGTAVKKGDIAFTVEGSSQSILQTERTVLNVMQRMSGIATTTYRYVKALEGTGTQVLDTRKTTPGMRILEKEAVRIGGGANHRIGLYDMILIKDNHIDFAGGIVNAITRCHEYLKELGKELKIEVEIRNLYELNEVLNVGGVDVIMLDNLSIKDTREAVRLIDGRFETESSGGITYESIRNYAECGVDFISVGALTHSVKSLDLSLKAV